MESEFYKEFVKFNEERKKKGLPILSRRDFLKAAGIAIAGFSLPALPAGFCQAALPPASPLEGTATVGIVKKDDIEDMVRTAIDLAGGLNEINPGDTVVIKPNITSKAGSGLRNVRVVTSPDVLRAVIRAVKDKTDATNITVADACAFGLSTREAAESNGIYDVCTDENVNFLAWEREKYVPFRHENFLHIKTSRLIPASLSSFDHFINVPILKNHEMVPYSNVHYTCCLKNFVGVLYPTNRYDLHTRDLGEKVAEVNLCVPTITMNIVDALTIIISGGPAGKLMKTADPGLVLASKDRVACDSLALAVLKHYASERGIHKSYVYTSVWKQAQIKRASQLGMGRTDPNSIIIMDEGVDNIQSILEKWC